MGAGEDRTGRRGGAGPRTSEEPQTPPGTERARTPTVELDLPKAGLDPDREDGSEAASLSPNPHPPTGQPSEKPCVLTGLESCPRGIL